MEETKELDKVQSEKVTLFIHGKEREIKFGFSAWGKLEKEYGGVKNLEKMQKEIEETPFETIPHLLYLGLKDKEPFTDSTGKKYPAITEENILEDYGMNDVQKITEVFAKALYGSLPQDTESEKKTGDGSINEFPWSYLLTECLLMGLTEEYFWESEPRKIIALIDQKKKIEQVKQKNLAIYIASYVWGKDPDAMEKKEHEPIPGIDIPVDESLLNRLM